MSRNRLGRADLLRTWFAYGEQLPADLLARLGYQPDPLVGLAKGAQIDFGPSGDRLLDDWPHARPDGGIHTPQRSQTPYWVPLRYGREDLAGDPGEAVRVLEEGLPQRQRLPPPPYRLLADFNDIAARLHALLSRNRRSNRVDVAQAVRRISRAQPLTTLPYASRRGWGARVVVLEDRSRHLIPYRIDQIEVAARLTDMYPAGGYQAALYGDTRAWPECVGGERPDEPLALRPGDQLLVLGDLGALSPTPSAGPWQALGEQCRDLGVPAIALVPFRSDECPDGLADLYDLLSWEHPVPERLDPIDLELRGEELLDHVSLTPCLEPGLFRRIRLDLGAAHFPARLESWVWSHAAMQGAQEVTALRDAEVPVRRRRLLRKLSGERLKRLLGRIQAALLPWSYELWLEAVLNLEDVVSLDAELRSADSRERAAVVAGFLSGEDRQAADRLLPYLAERLTNPLAVALPERSRTWVKGLALRAAAAIDARPNQGEALWRIRSGLERARRESRPVRQRETVTVRQTARGIGIDSASAIDAPSGLPPGSSLALLATRDGRLELRESSDDLPTQDDHAVLPDYPWASLRGIDSFGAWIEFEYRGVSQRLRWIPPGRFRMGSPEDEPGRFSNESPRHEILIEEGYWLFDTPVTQGLWEAVMGSNPSEFVSSERPVEQVSWNEAMEFTGKLNAAIPGLSLSLPSEAQWEYACRAGTETAVYSGELEILGINNAPALDAIAWYGGNSGEGYDLDEGRDTRDWKEQQYPNAKAGTREVKGKAANGWGLYDMLGNVWEWTEDTWHASYEGAPTDGSAWLSDEAEALRVLRGGSWDGYARYVRSACRYHDRPGDRYDNIGFRCARVQGELKSAEPRAGAEAARRGEVDAEREPNRAGRAGAGRLLGSASLESGGSVSLALPDPAMAPEGVVLRTDLEWLLLRPMRRKENPWATAMGRDRFGLWAEFRVESVRQRLRWIPPGRFQMGSPPEETDGLAQRDSEQPWFDAEHPRHEVVIEEGYWLMESPVTQGLWEAVMGSNPSEFVSPDRPVETVSWYDAQEFIGKLNAEIPGLGLSLPSEAQWEYACRAGTETAVYSGELEILGINNAPALDAIAWYSGNSGEGYDLDEGYDTSDWKEQQYPNKRAGTRVVKGKAANGWGLYDMLGNVWEWTEDTWHASYEGAPPDGSVWLSDEAEAHRVLRGGSWSSHARAVRSACRAHSLPDVRNDYIGFRCARVQGELKSAEPRAGAEAARRGEVDAEREPNSAGRAGAAGKRRGRLPNLIDGVFKRGKNNPE